MKKLVLFLVIFCAVSWSISAQNNVQFNINHLLGDVNFEMNTGAKNNIDNDFNVSRLQYYISEISIIHDGGTETAIEDLWILVDASEATKVDLGDHNITAVEAIHFHIGVDEAHNHLDPASWPADHPLAPSFPSMHWGWNAGYRFIAYEGMGGAGFNQMIQLHGLGDQNYFKTEVPVSATAENNVININLDADYARGLENIGVNSGVIVHGDYGEAKTALENFRDYVFTESENVNSTVDFSEVSAFDIFPNPAQGETTLFVSSNEDLTYQVSVSDVLGRQIQYLNEVKSNTSVELNLNQSGVFIVSLMKEGQPVISKRLISK